jgi:hypothetical protein
MERMKRARVRWWLAIALGGALLGGAMAYAQMPECWECYPCGCSPDGSTTLCCDRLRTC